MADTQRNLGRTAAKHQAVSKNVSPSTKMAKPAQRVFGTSSQAARATRVRGLGR